jgi:hypothetical protein
MSRYLTKLINTRKINNIIKPIPKGNFENIIKIFYFYIYYITDIFSINHHKHYI